IKELTCTYLIAPEQKEESSAKKEEANAKPGISRDMTDKPIEYKKMNEWNSDQKEEGAEQKALIPHFVEITAVLWNTNQRSDKSFTFTVPIYPDVQYLSSFAKASAGQASQPTPPGVAPAPA